jgi:hypothetical protein
MKVKIEGKVLSYKEKDNKRYIILSQMNNAGFQEIIKVGLKNGKVFKAGDEIELDVNLRAILTKDNKAILTAWA